MENQENPRVYSCLACGPLDEEGGGFKPTGKFETIRDHVKKFHPEMDRAEPPPVKSEGGDPPKKEGEGGEDESDAKEDDAKKDVAADESKKFLQVWSLTSLKVSCQVVRDT